MKVLLFSLFCSQHLPSQKQGPLILSLVFLRETWNTHLHHHKPHDRCTSISLTLQADSSQVCAPHSFLPTDQFLPTADLCAGEQSLSLTILQPSMDFMAYAFLEVLCYDKAFQSVLGHPSCVLHVRTLEKQRVSCGKISWTGFRW